jgi:hypothetical protein
MAGSSLVVTMNALRLQNPRRRAGEGQFVQTGKTSAA